MLAAVTLPVTAIGSVHGMNVIVNYRANTPRLIAVLVPIAAACAILLRWTMKRG